LQALEIILVIVIAYFDLIIYSFEFDLVFVVCPTLLAPHTEICVGVGVRGRGNTVGKKELDAMV
jgi:hypothetical protein